MLNKYLKCSVWRLAQRYDIYIYIYIYIYVVRLQKDNRTPTERDPPPLEPLPTISQSPRLSSKLSSALYIIRILKPILTIKKMKVIYYLYAYSIISYGLIFGATPVTVTWFLRFKKELLGLLLTPIIEHHDAIFKKRN